MQSERRRRRFLKKTREHFYPTEELLLAVPYRNASGAWSGQDNAIPTGPIDSLTKMLRMAQGEQPVSQAYQDRVDAIGSVSGETGIPPVAGWIAFTRERLLAFPASTRLELPRSIAVAHDVRDIADIEVRERMHNAVQATIEFRDGSRARLNVIDDGHLIRPVFELITGRRSQG